MYIYTLVFRIVDCGVDHLLHLPVALHLTGAFAGDLWAPGAPVAGREPPGVSGVVQWIPGISRSRDVEDAGTGVVSVGALPCMPASEQALVAEVDADDPGHANAPPSVSKSRIMGAFHIGRYARFSG